jgi:DNA-binding CsgD family transcriptional regulator
MTQAEVLNEIKWFLVRKEKDLENVDTSDNEIVESQAIDSPDVSPEIQRILERRDLIAIIRTDLGPLTKREAELFKVFLKDHDCKEIAEIMNEDVRIVTYELNNLRTKIISRFQRRFKVNNVTREVEKDNDLDEREKLFIAGLREKGLLIDLPKQTLGDEILGDFKRIKIKGEPLSETIIRERR